MTVPARMRAAVYHGPGDVRIEHRPVPRPGPGEVLLRVERSGICGTDASEYAHGPMLVPLHRPHPGSGHVGPLVLGHEFTGTVVDAADGVPVAAGSRLATGAGVWCGSCRWCQRGRFNLCASYYTLGLSTDGGLAEYAVAPARTCLSIPDTCGPDAAGLAQPLAVGLHAVRRAAPQPADTVVLVGAGAIGSFILAGLRAAGVRDIVALDVDPDRLAAARALGAGTGVDVRSADPVQTVRELTGGAGADVVIEATGAPGAAARAVAMATRGGRVLLVGLQPQPQQLDLLDVTLREVDLITTVAHVCPDDLPAALSLLAETDLGSTVVGRVLGLDRLVPDGIEALLGGRVRGKVLVDPVR